MSIDIEAYMCRADGKISTELDGETVILDMESGVYSGLDGVATRLWELLETESTMATLVDHIVAEYDIDREACVADVRSFLSEMIDAGLVIVNG